jgi:ATP-dependent exoDNAse (exonuclease V) alpha subunit
MTEASGFEAKTIHRLLEVDPKGGGFKRSDDNPLDCDLMVVDETSMVDVLLMQALMKAVPNNAALLIVGDISMIGTTNARLPYYVAADNACLLPPNSSSLKETCPRLLMQLPRRNHSLPILRCWS